MCKLPPPLKTLKFFYIFFESKTREDVPEFPDTLPLKTLCRLYYKVYPRPTKKPAVFNL